MHSSACLHKTCPRWSKKTFCHWVRGGSWSLHTNWGDRNSWWFLEKKCISFQSWRVIDQRKEDIEVGDVDMCVDPGRADINKIKYIVWNSQIINRKNIICIICLEYKGYSSQTSLLSNYIASTWHLTVEVDHDWFSNKPSAGLSHSNFLLPVSRTWKEDSISSWYWKNQYCPGTWMSI